MNIVYIAYHSFIYSFIEHAEQKKRAKNLEQETYKPETRLKKEKEK